MAYDFIVGKMVSSDCSMGCGLPPARASSSGAEGPDEEKLAEMRRRLDTLRGQQWRVSRQNQPAHVRGGHVLACDSLGRFQILDASEGDSDAWTPPTDADIKMFIWTGPYQPGGRDAVDNTSLAWPSKWQQAAQKRLRGFSTDDKRKRLSYYDSSGMGFGRMMTSRPSLPRGSDGGSHRHHEHLDRQERQERQEHREQRREQRREERRLRDGAPAPGTPAAAAAAATAANAPVPPPGWASAWPPPGWTYGQPLPGYDQRAQGYTPQAAVAPAYAPPTYAPSTYVPPPTYADPNAAAWNGYPPGYQAAAPLPPPGYPPPTQLQPGAPGGPQPTIDVFVGAALRKGISAAAICGALRKKGYTGSQISSSFDQALGS